MGSLMGGWSSRALDQEARRLRSRSLTKEEIVSFRKLSKEDKDGFESDPASPKTTLAPKDGFESEPASPKTTQAPPPYNAEEAKKDAWSLLKKRTRQSTLGILEGKEEEVVKPAKKLGTVWWMRSKWAFLNEPNYNNVNDLPTKYQAQGIISSH